MMFPTILLLFLLNSELALGLRYLKFERLASTAGPDGLRCAVDHYDRGISRGVKIESQSGICTPLEESWFSDQLQDANHVYYKLVVMEDAFQPALSFTSALPYGFQAWSSIVVHVHVGTIPASLGTFDRFAIKISSDNSVCFLLSARFDENILLVNHMNNGVWGNDQTEASPLTQSNKTYRLEIFVTLTGYDLYVDDGNTPVHEFQHQIDLSVCDNVELIGSADFAVFERLQYFYPL